MCGAMVNGSAVIKAVDGVERHGLVRAEKDRRLIHVVPESGDAHGDKILVKAAPPIARAGQSEIREDTVAGPYFADENGPIGVFHEDVVPNAGIVRRVAMLVIDVEVDDVSGNFLFTKSLDNLADAGLGIIAVAALLVAERP